MSILFIYLSDPKYLSLFFLIFEFSLEKNVTEGFFPDLILLGESLFLRIIAELFDNIAENLFYPLE